MSDPQQTPPETETSTTPSAEPRSERLWHGLFALVLVAYLALSGYLVATLPLWGGVADEPIHFGYCKYIAVKGHLPALWDHITDDLHYYYLAPGAGEAAHHPPSYYLLGSLVCRAFLRTPLPVQNYAVRAMSLLLGFLSLCFLYPAFRLLMPRRPELALAAVAFVAVFPQRLLMCSIIAPEPSGIFAASAALWMFAHYRATPQRWGWLWGAGAMAGMMALTKSTLLPFCVAFFVTALVLPLQSGLSRREKGLAIGGFMLCGALVCVWWYVRNIVEYGQLVPTSVTPGSLDTAVKVAGGPDMIALLFLPRGRFYYKLAVTGIFWYFWCPSDWVPAGIRPVFLAIAALTWIGAIVGIWWGRRRREPLLDSLWKPILLPFLWAIPLLFIFYLRWTVTTCIQAHAEFGKFVMPVLGYLTLLLALGLNSLFGRRAALLLAAFVLFFVAWDLVAYHNLATVLIPTHAGDWTPPPY
jgi:hypothetical protein